MEEIDKLNEELSIQKRVAYTAGKLYQDITVKILLECLAEGVVIVNDEGRIILINSRLSKMTAFSKEEVLGESLNILIPESTHTRHSLYIKEFFEAPKIRPMGVNLNLIAKRKDNSTFPIEISLSYLKTDTGVLGIGFITDISERKLAEEELLKKNKELDDYAHIVAHDLTSSLYGVVGYSELLLESKNEISDSEKDEYLEQIMISGKKMNNIIQELLIFASMKKGEVKTEILDMKTIIDSSLQRLKYQINKLSAKIHVHEELANCTGYAGWIEEVLFNFISNALKYGGNPPIIEIYSEKLNNGFVKYSVKDNGNGIDPEHKEIIFEDKNNKKEKLTKGLGLGLTIVKRIIEKLNGYVSVESEIGKGSIFSFYLQE